MLRRLKKRPDVTVAVRKGLQVPGSLGATGTWSGIIMYGYPTSI